MTIIPVNGQTIRMSMDDIQMFVMTTDELTSSQWYDQNIDEDHQINKVSYNAYENSKQTHQTSSSTYANQGYFVLGLVLAAIFAWVHAHSKKEQMITKRSVKEANEYVQINSFRISQSDDTFLYKTVDKVKKPDDDQSH